MRGIKKLAAAVVLAVASLTLAGPAFAHQAKHVEGQVDCAGNYTIRGVGDWYGDVHMLVTLDGEQVGDFGPNADQADHAFRVSGTGGAAGEVITARASDQEVGVSGVLVANGDDCRPQVSPVAPIVTQSSKCGVEGIVDIPEQQAGVSYVATLDGVETLNLTGPGVVVVTFSADEGFTLVGESTYTYTLTAAEKCETPTPTPSPSPSPKPPVKPSVTPEAPLSTPRTGISGGAIAAMVILGSIGIGTLWLTRRRSA